MAHTSHRYRSRHRCSKENAAIHRNDNDAPRVGDWPGTQRYFDESRLRIRRFEDLGDDLKAALDILPCGWNLQYGQTAVIDNKSKVLDMENLRIIDLSGVPFLPPGQPQATVNMLAEKIVDFILEGA